MSREMIPGGGFPLLPILRGFSHGAKTGGNLTHTSDSLQLRMMMLSHAWQTTEPSDAYANNNY